MQEYLKQLPIEILSGHWDGYSYNKNNFYLYYNPVESRFEYIPYDTDNTFGIDWVDRDWADRNIYDWAKHGEPRPLHKRILAISRYHEEFTKNMNELLESKFTSNYQMNIANSYRALIQESVYTDTYYPQDFGYTNQTFDDSYIVNFVVSHAKYGIQPFIEKRAQKAKEQLDQSVLSTSDLAIASDILFYPNPVLNNEVLYFDLSGNFTDNMKISLWNTMGQKIFEKNIRANQSKYGILLDNISSGIYILKGNYENSGIRVMTSKIIVQ